jgi:hypothetical protein
MLGITTSSFTRTAPSSSQILAANTLSDRPGSAFQPVALTALPSQPASMPRAGGLVAVSSSLGAQTVSTLLQTQDISQTPVHGGHGGGGHHDMKTITPGLEAEAAEESEEAQILKRRKKLLEKMQAGKAAETDDTDEKGEQRNENTPEEKAG